MAVLARAERAERLCRAVVEENAELKRRNEELSALAAQLSERLSELERRLGKNPRNSSKPPSSEGLSKPPPKPKSLRKRSGRKPGGQKGHPGAQLEQVKVPDEIVPHWPVSCGKCGDGLDGARITGFKRRQVFDLPEARPQVTEHRLLGCRCSCGTVTWADGPAGVRARAQYGPRVAAAVAYLAGYQHLPSDRCSQAMADLFGTPVSEGYVAGVAARAHAGLAGFESALKEALAAAPAAGADETGARIGGRTAWIHVLRTETLTWYGACKGRGLEAMRTFGILPRFEGILVHDGLRAYRFFGAGHQLCNAHHLRELTACYESDPVTQAWAALQIQLLTEMNDTVNAARAAGQDRLSGEAIAALTARYEHNLKLGNSANLDGNKTSRDAVNLIGRLDRYKDDVTRFLHDFSLPFDNNGSERDIRMIKTQMKISGCWRTLAGAERFCRLRSYISTIRKNGLTAINALVRLFAGNPWIPDRATA